MRVPKRIPADRLRATMGDVEYERTILAMYGPDMSPGPVIHLKPDQIELALSLLQSQGTTEERRRIAMSAAVYRKYLAQPNRRGRFFSWAKKELHNLNGEGEGQEEARQVSPPNGLGPRLKQAKESTGMSLAQIAKAAHVPTHAIYSVTNRNEGTTGPNAVKLESWLVQAGL